MPARTTTRGHFLSWLRAVEQRQRGELHRVIVATKKKDELRFSPGPSLPAQALVVLAVGADLPADLAARMLVGVHVRVGLAGAHGPDQLRDLARGDALARGADDVGGGKSAAEAAGAGGAGWLATAAAEKDRDAAVDVLLSQVDVGRRRNGALQTFVAQRPIDGVAADPCDELAATRAMNSPRPVLETAGTSWNPCSRALKC